MQFDSRNRRWPIPSASNRLRVALFASFLFFPFGAVSRAGEAYAMVVSVNDSPRFYGANLTPHRPLKGAEADADAIAKLLERQFNFPAKNVLRLKSASATHANVKRAFEEMIARLKADDVFVFYFSGHGTQIPDQPPFDEPDGLDEALCLYDSESTGRNLLIDDELGLWLEKIPARHVTVILDCCHAGTGTKEVDEDIVPRFLPVPQAKPDPRSTKRPWREVQGSAKAIDRETLALFACQPDQQAFERRFVGQVPVGGRVGQFTHFLLEGLRDSKADADHKGFVSAREAIDYAQKRMDESFNLARPHRVDQQQPMLEATHENAPLFRPMNRAN